MCFVKDYFRKKYFLILFAVHEFKTEPIWEHQINDKMTENMTFKESFIQFDGIRDDSRVSGTNGKTVHGNGVYLT